MAETLNNLDPALLGVLADLFWRLRIILGLVLCDVVLGVAAASKYGDFDWSALGLFYKTNVLPYLLGYLVLFGTVHFIFPADVPGVSEYLNFALVNAAWAALILPLVRSVLKNGRELYDAFQMDEPRDGGR